MMRADCGARENAPRQFESRHRGQVDVEHADIGPFGEEYPLAAFRIGGFEDRDLRLAGEQGAATGSHDGMIVDNQNTHRR